jgi:hypothetical protein
MNSGAAGSRVDGWSPDLRTNETRATVALLIEL